MTVRMFGFGRLSAEGKVGIASGVVFFSMLISRTLLSERVNKNTRASLFRVQFLLFINSLLLLGSLYIWKRVVRRLCGARGAPSVPQRCWRLLVLLFLTLVHGSYLCMFFLVDTEPHWLSLLSFSCLGIYVILLFFLFVFGCLIRLRRLLSRSRGGEEDAVASGSVSHIVLAMILTAILAVYGLVNAAQPPRVIEVEIPVEKLPESLNGLRLVLLSDIHLGPTVGRSKLQRIVTMVNELNPDVVVIVGDLTDSQVTRLKSAAEPLGQMKAQLGSYFATGNHDYYTADVEGWFELLRSMGIQSLHNSHAKVFRPTHAGQLFPLTILAFLMNPFFCGLYRVSEHTMVYVTPGTGHYGIPMRIASRSEITNIILKRA
ncbi:transmembrane protein with metallophosphoesterase domain-like [Sinocyclocheilus rhinocerous]|uniref:transmembrane protein with metallophosphoesterase domain-like n=1 Tax=Sinocyclocheilus rhinocerous TaxID=307959 RepID=UPI0007B869C1|nr:PREDICTED: transmembrane protein with metallophosphoesterase domain-like [Sinocyclocheilus rhinocerous]